MKTIDSAHNTFIGNPVFDQMGTAVGKAIVRLDADINGQKKAASQLTTTELYTIGILSDFYKRLKTDDALDLYFQNSCFSDKNTHFLIPYNKKKFQLNSSTNLQTALDDIIKNNNARGIKTFEDAIFNSRKIVYTKILNNLVEDYKLAIKKADPNQNNATYNTILTNLNSNKSTQLLQLKELATNSEKWKKLFFNDIIYLKENKYG